MGLFRRLLLVFFITGFVYQSVGLELYEEEQQEYKWPTIGISILIRNKQDSLPYFFTSLSRLDYPKDRLYIWIHSDYNEDNSVLIVEEWKKKYGAAYNGVYITVDPNTGPLQSDQTSSSHWSPERFRHVIKLREKALQFGIKMWADYVFMLDADVFLKDPLTLKSLVSKDYAIVAPMLISDGLYSNFWAGMTESYFYKRTDDYKTILNRGKVGCFQVPMVHTAVLINMKLHNSDKLTYNPNNIKNYDGPEDDIITFAVNAKRNDINLTVCNDLVYGFVPIPIDEKDSLRSEQDQILNVKMEALGRGVVLPLDLHMEKFVYYPKKWKFGLNEIFMINLDRRVERRMLMEQSFTELGIEVTVFKAVDGKDLDMRDLKQLGVTLLPQYEDPYHRRSMKAGEVGCFLSHYSVWKEITKRHLGMSLVLEDDVHFVPYFRQRFIQLLEEIRDLDWDIVYIGRKILLDGKEEYVTEHVTKPLYSYWTLGYLISERGARKLIKAEPLSKMVPVDEFLPIMFDEHPNATWKSFFANRNLKAFSAAPLLVHPTHYTGDEGYISDTEDSKIMTAKVSSSPRAEDAYRTEL